MSSLTFHPLLLCLCCRITLYDYQALCREYAGSSDSARSLSNVRQNSSWFKDKDIRNNTFTICFTTASTPELESVLEHVFRAESQNELKHLNNLKHISTHFVSDSNTKYFSLFQPFTVFKWLLTELVM